MNRAFMFIIIGAILWGTISFYVKSLYAYGFTPMEVVTLRAWSAAIVLVVYLLIASPMSLKLLHVTDIKYFIGTGIFSIIFFNYCMFQTMELATIPISAALLYTGPAFVIIISYFLFKEPLTKNKLVALLMTLIGTTFVVGLIPFDVNTVQFSTILIGLGSGFGYALYSIFSKFALKKYSSITITTFTFIIASITLIPFFPYEEKVHLLFEPKVLLFVFGLGLFPTALAYIVYTYGLHRTEASKAAILSTIEPVVATLFGMFVFLEPFSFLQIIGMSSIILAVIFIQIGNKQSDQSQQHKVKREVNS